MTDMPLNIVCVDGNWAVRQTALHAAAEKLHVSRGWWHRRCGVWDKELGCSDCISKLYDALDLCLKFTDPLTEQEQANKVAEAMFALDDLGFTQQGAAYNEHGGTIRFTF